MSTEQDPERQRPQIWNGPARRITLHRSTPRRISILCMEKQALRCCVVIALVVSVLALPSSVSGHEPEPHAICSSIARDPELAGPGVVVATGGVWCSTGGMVIASRLTNALQRSRWYGFQTRATGDTGIQSLTEFLQAERIIADCSGTTHDWRHTMYLEVSLAEHPDRHGWDRSNSPRYAC